MELTGSKGKNNVGLLSLEVCEQQRRRSAQSDQCLCYFAFQKEAYLNLQQVKFQFSS